MPLTIGDNEKQENTTTYGEFKLGELFRFKADSAHVFCLKIPDGHLCYSNGNWWDSYVFDSMDKTMIELEVVIIPAKIVLENE